MDFVFNIVAPYYCVPWDSRYSKLSCSSVMFGGDDVVTGISLVWLASDDVVSTLPKH